MRTGRSPATEAPLTAPPVEPLVHRQPGRSRRARSRAARVWAAVSVLLALVGIASIAVARQEQHGTDPVRYDVPVALVPPPPVTVLRPAPAASPRAPDPAASPPLAAPGASVAPVDPAASPRPADPAAIGGAPAVSPLPASRPVRLTIPVLRVTSPVMDLGLTADGAMEMPPGAYPVGWYDRGPTPGQTGPAVIVGHVDWAGERGALYGLRVVRPGDRVVVDRADGTTAVFQVDRVERHAKDDFPTDEVYGDVGWPALRLITCGGRFDTRSGRYEDNVIAFARLVGTA